MRNTLLSFILGAAAVGASAQPFVGGFASFPPQPPPPTLLSPITAATPTEIPMWSYSVTADAALGSGAYSGQIIGRSPFLKGKATTTIPLQIIPVKIVINNGLGDTHIYDPTINDGCQAGTLTPTQIVQYSPVFTNTTWTMDGVNVGTTQYHDAHLRASFWSLVQGSSYHLNENVTIVDPTPTTTTTWYFGSVGDGVHTPLGPGTNYVASSLVGAGGCGDIGVVNINDLNNALNNTVGALSPTVNIGTLPMLITDSVVAALDGSSIYGPCCALGFHSGFNPTVSTLQVDSIFVLDSSNVFGGDVSVISHELGEAIFDPSGNNATPVWGSIGQDSGNCPSGGGQNNLEVGDPLSPGYPAVANEHVVNPSSPTNSSTDSNEWQLAGTGTVAAFGTYHLQELTMFDWFFGDTPHLGITGYFSNNGTLQGAAKPCSTGGGTN